MTMSRKPRSPVIAGGEHHRFLRPGALARLRDAKLRRRPKPPSRLLRPSSPSPSPPPAAAADGGAGGVLHFVSVSRFLGPRCPQRKKLAAAKAVFFAPPSPSPERVEVVLEFLNPPDMVVAAH